MNKRKQIELAADIGYFATIDLGETIVQVIMVNKKRHVLVYKTPFGNVVGFPIVSFEKFKIIGYLYAGELGGNGEIPEGQKFREKNERGLVGRFLWHRGPSKIELIFDDDGIGKQAIYDKSEISPVFNT